MGNMIKSCLTCLEYCKDNITDEEKNKNNISINIKNKIHPAKDVNNLKEKSANNEENIEINK